MSIKEDPHYLELEEANQQCKRLHVLEGKNRTKWVRNRGN